MGGRALLAIDGHALRHLASGRQVALVSGTNGKTTTTTLLAAALGGQGPVVTNLLGANLPAGIAAALATGEPGAPAALEVDEAWLATVVEATAPRVVALLNLSRDQLDRNNEVRQLAASWRRIFARPGPTVVANADDPLVVWAAAGAAAAGQVRWIGAGQPWTADASGCPACGGRIAFAVGEGWACTGCDLARPALDLGIEGDELVAASGRRHHLDLRLPGRANRANAAMALAVVAELGVDSAGALAAMADLDEVVGRYRRVTVGGAEVRLLLAKNPAGWLEVLDVLAPPPRPVVVAINARIADGRDPSWLWDVPFEQLAGRPVIATGERSRDLAVRLHYAEVEHRRIDDSLTAVAVAAAEGGPVEAVGNYTAFQVLRGGL